MKFKFTYGLLLLLSNITFAQIDSALTNQFQQFLEDQRTYYGDHGIAATVVMSNGDNWNGFAGVDPLGNPITDTSLFYGASTLKVYVASIILLLEQNGQLGIDDHYTQYIPPIVNADTNITIRQLLNHTSGNFNFVDNISFLSSIIGNPTQIYQPGDALTTFFTQGPYFSPGAGWHYSNSNYVILSMIIESITGNNLQMELRNRFWTPLGMTHTYLGVFESYTQPIAGVWADPTSSGTLTDFNSVSHNSILSVGWGTMSIVTTPADEATFIRALMTGQILADSSLQQMMQWVDHPSFNTFLYNYDYGMGLEREIRFTGDTLVGHSGDLGNITYMYHSITNGYTIVTMTNSEVSNPKFAFNLIHQLINNSLITSHFNNSKKDINIKIYPNPVIDLLHVKSDLKILSATVMNLSGQVVLQKEDTNMIDVSTLSKGIYIINFNTVLGTHTCNFVK
ncbi:MAG: serine hydrolase [Saprospiraceae bacterium]|nr:serine hydrolase [Saprospiraceae bacterium]